MEKKLKELLQKSKEILEHTEEKIDEISETFTEDARVYWKELRGQLEKVGDKLKLAYEDLEGEAELKSHLLMMEARERMEMLKDEIDTFVTRATHKSEKELDLIALKAHLAKMDAEELLEEKEKEFRYLYSKSKIEAQKVAEKALHEVNTFFLKLTEIV